MNTRVSRWTILLVALTAFVSAWAGIGKEVLDNRASAQVPPQTISLDEVFEQVEHQTSYQMTEVEDDLDPVTVLVIREPSSVYVSGLMDLGEAAIVYMRIGQREWLGVDAPAGIIWAPVSAFYDGTLEQYNWYLTNVDAQIVSEYVTTTRALIELLVPNFLRGVLPEGQQATLTRSDRTVDNFLCAEYVWTTDNAEGTVCLREDGLPVATERNDAQGRRELRFTRFNDPGNVFTVPLADFSQHIHWDDARMALNGLSSYRVSGTRDIQDGPESPLFQVEAHGEYRAVWTQANQGWLAYFEQVAPEATLALMEIDQEWWFGGVPDLHWVTVLYPEDYRWVSMFGYLHPLGIWRGTTTIEDEYGEPQLLFRASGLGLELTRVGDGEYLVNGVRCNEYQATAPAERGAISRTVRLFASADTGLPVYVEAVVKVMDDTLTETWALSYVNDPTNVVAPPDSQGYSASTEPIFEEPVIEPLVP